MEPKLKAEELIRKFKPMVQFKMGVDPSYVLRMAIKCALVSVDEILETTKVNWRTQRRMPDGTWKIFTGVSYKKYWVEVKKQIEDYGKK